MIIDPVRIYQSKEANCKVFTASVQAAVANNTVVVGGVTDKIIRVMGWKIQSNNAAVGTFQFKSASGGTVITPLLTAPPNSGGLTNDLPITNCGYMETLAAGQGLYVDVTVQAVSILIFYIIYRP